MAKRNNSGASLLEVLIATCSLAIVMIMLGLILQRLGGSKRESDLQRIAAGMAHDALENYRMQPFSYLYVTGSQDASGEGCLSSSSYDRNLFPPQRLPWGSWVFLRTTCIEMVTPEKGAFQKSDPSPSTGLKRIIVRVSWPADHPRRDFSLESIVQDPQGPEMAGSGKGVIQSKVQCTQTNHTDRCEGVVFRLYNEQRMFMDSAISDGFGDVVFKHVPLGLHKIRPVLHSEETADPQEIIVRMANPEEPMTIPGFVVTRNAGSIHVKTNQPGTLVSVEEGPPAVTLPAFTFDQDAPAGLYGTVVDEEASLRVVAGTTYSIRCWGENAKGERLAVRPLGGINRFVPAGSTLEILCVFKK